MKPVNKISSTGCDHVDVSIVNSAQYVVNVIKICEISFSWSAVHCQHCESNRCHVGYKLKLADCQGAVLLTSSPVQRGPARQSVEITCALYNDNPIHTSHQTLKMHNAHLTPTRHRSGSFQNLWMTLCLNMLTYQVH